MVAGAASLVEIVLNLVAGVLGACVYILAASVRPWRSLLSRSFRTKVNAQYVQSHPFFKWWDLFWGFLALLASVAIVAALVVLISKTSSSRPVDATEHRRALHKIERAIVRELMEKQSAD